MVKPTISTRYLGVIFNQNLKWNEQLANVIEKGSKWAAQIRRATCPSWGIMPKYARKLYICVAFPKVMYAINIWCIPAHGPVDRPKAKGSGRQGQR
jgi:hypothetical protein